MVSLMLSYGETDAEMTSINEPHKARATKPAIGNKQASKTTTTTTKVITAINRTDLLGNRYPKS
jgi:hypothetical protein